MKHVSAELLLRSYELDSLASNIYNGICPPYNVDAHISKQMIEFLSQQVFRSRLAVLRGRRPRSQGVLGDAQAAEIVTAVVEILRLGRLVAQTTVDVLRAQENVTLEHDLVKGELRKLRCQGVFLL